MARLTKEERAELEARLAADEDDEDDEVELGFADGSHFRGKMSRARQVAAARGYKIDPDPPAEPKEPKGKGDGEGEVKRFSSGRRIG